MMIRVVIEEFADSKHTGGLRLKNSSARLLNSNFIGYSRERLATSAIKGKLSGVRVLAGTGKPLIQNNIFGMNSSNPQDQATFRTGSGILAGVCVICDESSGDLTVLSNTIRFAESSMSSGVWIGNLAGKKNISSNLIFNQTLYPHYPNRFNPRLVGSSLRASRPHRARFLFAIIRLSSKIGF